MLVLSCWANGWLVVFLLHSFATVFENGNLSCRLVDRSCSPHGYDGHRSSISVPRTPRSTFLQPHYIQIPISGWALLLQMVLLVIPQGERAVRLDQHLDLHTDEKKQTESHPCIFHMAFDWWGTDSSGMGGLSLALSVSAGALRDRGYGPDAVQYFLQWSGNGCKCSYIFLERLGK